MRPHAMNGVLRAPFLFGAAPRPPMDTADGHGRWTRPMDTADGHGRWPFRPRRMCADAPNAPAAACSAQRGRRAAERSRGPCVCAMGASDLERSGSRGLSSGAQTDDRHAQRGVLAPDAHPRRNAAARRVKCRQTQGVPPADAVPSCMEAIVGKFIEIKR
ncbi:hypothetical protein Y047_6131 [Burkholderia pseudomallei MSHR3016]|nr:hypothetical protein Y047_6131 [Burkholderia pseudomallei MSHR3016]